MFKNFHFFVSVEEFEAGVWSKARVDLQARGSATRAEGPMVTVETNPWRVGTNGWK